MDEEYLKEEISPPPVKKKTFKKFLPLIILVALVFVAGASFYFWKTFIKPDPISLLPKETSFYLRIKINPENQQVKNLKEILNKFPYYEKVAQKIGQTFEEAKEKNPPLKNLDFTISDEIILAFIAPFKEDTEEFPLVLILPNPDLKKLEKLAKDVKVAIEESENWELEEETYKGRKILKALPIVKTPSWMKERYPSLPPPPAPKYKPSSTFTNGHLFLASKPEDIKKIIDVAESQKITSIFEKEKIKNITSSTAYRRINKYLPKDYLLLFYGEVDWSKILKAAEVKTAEETKFLSPFLASLKSALNLPFLKSKEVKEPEKLATAGVIIAEKNQLKSETYSLDLRKEAFLPSQFSIENSLAKFIPAKIGKREIVFYSEGRNLKNSIEEVEKTLEKQLSPKEKEEFQKFLESLKENLGVDLKKDIFPLFEKNYAFFLAAEPSGKERPLVGLVFEITDENKVKENLLKLKIPKFGFEDILGLTQARARAKDARIMADMAQMRTIAELIYSDNAGFSNFSCYLSGGYSDDMQNLCKDIKEQVGAEPVIHSSWNQYCAYTKLNEPGGYYCIDSEMTAKKTYIDPGQIGYCTGKTFLCPKEEGIPLESFFQPEAEKVGFSKEIIHGIEIYSLPLGDGFGLNFLIKDKKLIFAFTKEGLIDILQNLTNEKKLKDSEIFTEQFKRIPKKISSISFTFPYGFLGPIKYFGNFYINFLTTFSGGAIPEKEEVEKITSAIEELLEKGIAPYLKVLKSTGDYSYSLEENLRVTKGKLIIQELSNQEKRETEAFWDNFPTWIMEKSAPPPVYEEEKSTFELKEEKLDKEKLPPSSEEVKEYEIFSQEVAFRGSKGQAGHLPIRSIIIPPETKIYKIEGYLKAFNRDPTFPRSVGIAVGSHIPNNCQAGYYLTLGPNSIEENYFNLDPNLFHSGPNLITSWVSTYGEWGGVESWVTLKLKFFYSGKDPMISEGVMVLEENIDPISCNKSK